MALGYANGSCGWQDGRLGGSLIKTNGTCLLPGFGDVHFYAVLFQA